MEAPDSNAQVAGLVSRVRRLLLWTLVLGPGPLLADAGVRITEAEHEGRAQFKVATAAATYFYDRAGGGFSRLIDRDGLDWISFKKEPLSKFPESAAAGYRGIPNAVFGMDNPDAGAGHPGFDLCESALVSSNVIRTASKSGRWSWTWTFSETTARLRFEKVDAERGHWFLYEGTPGGRYSPTNQFWGTDLGGPNFDVPAIKSQCFGKWRWAYFGERSVPRVLAIAQAQPDDLDDTFWYLGSTNGGAADSPDGTPDRVSASPFRPALGALARRLRAASVSSAVFALPMARLVGLRHGRDWRHGLPPAQLRDACTRRARSRFCAWLGRRRHRGHRPDCLADRMAVPRAPRQARVETVLV
jgi:hypothetical protein